MAIFEITNFYTNPSTPMVGQTATAYMSIFNHGPADLVQARISSNNTIIHESCYDPNGDSICDKLGANSSWTVSGQFILTGTAKIYLYTHVRVNNQWITDDVQIMTITPGTATCTGASLYRDKTFAGIGTNVTFTAKREPAAAGVVGTLKDTYNNTVYTRDTCTTGSDGRCTITWKAAGIGTHDFKIHFDGCSSGSQPAYVQVGNPGDIIVTSVNISPNSATNGQSITITANLRNDGDFSESENVYLKSDGTIIDTVFATVQAGSTGTIRWTKIAGSNTGFGVGTHNICAVTSGDEKCTSLTISGSDYYYKCENNVCNQKQGTGISDCTPGSACGSQNYYYKCENNVCNQKQGTGINDCTPGSACGGSVNNYGCVGNECRPNSGNKPFGCNNECAPSTSCGQHTCYRCNGTNCENNPSGTLTTCDGNPCGAGGVHLECKNGICQNVSGEGNNKDGCSYLGQICKDCDGIKLSGTCIPTMYLIGGLIFMVFMMTQQGSGRRR